MAKQSAYLQRRDAQLDAVFWAGAAMAAQFAVDTLQMTMHQQEGWGYEQLYPFRRGRVIYIHPKGRFVSVRTETAGGPVVENFRLCEVVM